MIPVTLGDTEYARVFPAYNRNIVVQIRHFIVENVRSARRFLKNAGVKDIFCVSVTQSTGMEALRAALLCRQKVQERPEHCHLEDAEVYS